MFEDIWNVLSKMSSPKSKKLWLITNMKLYEKSECIVVVTDHPEFKQIKPDLLKEKGIRVVVDGRNILDKEKIKSLGIIYEGIGR